MLRSPTMLILASALLSVVRADEPWTRHTIDRASKETGTRGADGVRLADVNGDGHKDIVTGWEEGGVIRVCMNPGSGKAKRAWPAVSVGRVTSPEDAVFVDLDGDGAMDVVSCCEGGNRTVFVHWAPPNPAEYRNGKAWKTTPIDGTQGKQAWMFALPFEMDGQNGIDVVAGSKGRGASVSWLQSPKAARETNQWKLHQLCSAGWIMSLVARDIDRDGDPDIILSDRKGEHRGVWWLRNPGEAGGAWDRHLIGAADREVMFIDVADIDGDRRMDVVAAVKPAELVVLRQPDDPAKRWPAHVIELPSERIGTSKAVRVADVNLDGRVDLVFSCEQASGGKSGVGWLSYETSPLDTVWKYHEISGPAGVKFDLVQMLDLDDDGDLDVITCEERDQLGVFWYENPHRADE